MILKRYINSEILRTCVAILAVLVLIFISTRFVKYIQLAVEGTISSNAMFSLLGLQLPAIAGFILPLAFFCAILLTFGRLYSENEMAVIHSVGIGEFQLAKKILPLAVAIALVSAILSFFVNPWSSITTKTLMAQEQAEAKFGAFSPGRFQQNSDQTGVIYVASKDDRGGIAGIFVVSNSLNDEGVAQIQIQTAASGRLWQEENSDNNQNFLVLEEGTNYHFDGVKQRWDLTDYSGYFMRMAPIEREAPRLKTKSLSTFELLKQPQAPQWAELHWRLAFPLSVLVLCFMAVPLARSRPRQGKFARLLPAIMIYLVYALLMMNGKRFLETEKIPLVLGFWWIHGLAIAFCFWLYRPMNKEPSKSLKKKGAINV